MAAIATQKPAVTGVALTYAAAAGGGDSFQNHGHELVHVKNGGGSPVTVTITAGNANANKCSFGVANAAHARVVVIGAGADAMIGPMDPTQFNDSADGLTCYVTYSGVTTVTVAVLSLT